MIKFRLPFLILLTAFCVLPCRADLPTLTVLHTFGLGGPGDLTPSHNANSGGSRPEATLVQGPDGMLYGTTSDGGTHGTGVIFKIGAEGAGYTVLHSFDALEALFTNDTNLDGGWPIGRLAFGTDNALYGVASQGGPGGSGTIFKLKTDGSDFTILHSFEPKHELYRNSGGASPLGLTLGPKGALFGVAKLGGSGRGLIFTLTQNGKNFHVLHSFDSVDQNGNANDGGAVPAAAVIFGRGDVLYGTANVGGRGGNGVIYKMDADGRNFTVLHDFQRKTKDNGVFPGDSLTLGADNFLYGCTRQGGASDGGIVYKISADGTAFAVLHTFSDPNSSNADGTLPAGPLVFGTDECLYGVSGGGGETGSGTLFKMTADGAKFFTLHDFSSAEGGYARAGLTPGHDGSLYGVSTNGGANKTGTLFRVTFAAAK